MCSSWSSCDPLWSIAVAEMTDETAAELYFEVMEAVSVTLKQFVAERCKGDGELGAEITETASDAIISVAVCMRCALVGAEISEGEHGPLMEDVSNSVWDLVEKWAVAKEKKNK